MWESISNLWQLYGPNMNPTTLLLFVAGGLLVGFPMLPVSVQTKIKSMLANLKPGKKTVTVAFSSDTIEHALDLVEDLAHMKRIADAKLVLDLIGGIQKDEPVAPVSVAPAGPVA